MWKGTGVSRCQVLHECWKQCVYCRSFILNSSMLLPRVANGYLLTRLFKPPSPAPGHVRGGPTSGMGDDRWVLRVPCLRWICHFSNSFLPAAPCTGHWHHWHIAECHRFKILAAACEFCSAFSVKHWQVAYKNIMLMGYILWGLFQTLNSASPASQIVVLTQTRQSRQWGNGRPEEGIPQASKEGFAIKKALPSTASVCGLCAQGLSRKDCKVSKLLSWLVQNHIKVKQIKSLW